MNSKARSLVSPPPSARRISLPLRRTSSARPAAPAEMALHPALLLRDVLAAAQGLASDGGRAAATPPPARLETLPARGTLLRDSLLGPGDLIMLQPEAPVADGELAVVHLDGATAPVLRRVHSDGGWLRLVPEDQRFPVELRPTERVRVLGRVLSIMRQARPASQVPLAI
jgi:hypothetical protein